VIKSVQVAKPKVTLAPSEVTDAHRQELKQRFYLIKRAISRDASLDELEFID